MQTRLHAELLDLLRFYWKNEKVPQNYRNSPELQLIQDRCSALFSRDYLVSLVQNEDLCPTYPLQIILCEWQVSRQEESTLPASQGEQLRKHMTASKDSRARQRFPVPVIRLGKKYICRSAGLAEKAELVLRKATDPVSDFRAVMSSPSASKTDARLTDGSWLNRLQIRYIIDLMNERQRAFMGVAVCSGELASGLYREFSVSALPYPGVSTFKSFSACRAKELPLPVAKPKSTKDTTVATLNLACEMSLPGERLWADYEKWNIVELLQHYLVYIFHLLRSGEEEDGLLLHCISGWDRTPLFIGIIRILLWAEGLIHQQLDVDELLFIVLGYDWVLFGHQFAGRMKKGYEVLYYAFWVLPYLMDQQYSYSLISRRQTKLNSDRRPSRASPLASPSPRQSPPSDQILGSSPPRPKSPPKSQEFSFDMFKSSQEKLTQPKADLPTPPTKSLDTSQSATPTVGSPRQKVAQRNDEEPTVIALASFKIINDYVPDDPFNALNQRATIPAAQFTSFGNETFTQNPVHLNEDSTIPTSPFAEDPKPQPKPADKPLELRTPQKVSKPLPVVPSRVTRVEIQENFNLLIKREEKIRRIYERFFTLYSQVQKEH